MQTPRHEIESVRNVTEAQIRDSLINFDYPTPTYEGLIELVAPDGTMLWHTDLLQFKRGTVDLATKGSCDAEGEIAEVIALCEKHKLYQPSVTLNLTLNALELDELLSSLLAGRHELHLQSDVISKVITAIKDRVEIAEDSNLEYQINRLED